MNTRLNTAAMAFLITVIYLTCQAKLNSALAQNTIPSDWKTYTNDKYGFSFQYPSTWVQQGKEYESINLTGAVVLIGVIFKDTISQTVLTIEYHLAPNGANLYQYALSQYNSSKGNYGQGRNKITVAGQAAIQASNIWKYDGKGHTLSTPSRSITVDFLDKKKTGEIELQFDTSLINENVEIIKLEKILSTFRLIDN